MIVMIDNYDSFTYNIVQYLREMGAEVRPVRNDRVSLEALEAWAPAGLVISPGPGRPEGAGISMDAIRRFSGRIPLLGVCLGHQAIARVFGAEIVRAGRLMHGKTSEIRADGQGVFHGLNRPFKAMRYHSLAVDRKSLPAVLAVTAESEDGEIMGLRHREHSATEGVQFHPESIMTPVGKRILRNFLRGFEANRGQDSGGNG